MPKAIAPSAMPNVSAPVLIMAVFLLDLPGGGLFVDRAIAEACHRRGIRDAATIARCAKATSLFFELARHR
jgi:hypothetical protein